jgi:predicted TIM-barrel fold metal-dependent hydrolase
MSGRHISVHRKPALVARQGFSGVTATRGGTALVYDRGSIIFASQRRMFESNFPVGKQSCGYEALRNAIKRITQNCPAMKKAALYRDTAACIFRPVQ